MLISLALWHWHVIEEIIEDNLAPTCNQTTRIDESHLLKAPAQRLLLLPASSCSEAHASPLTFQVSTQRPVFCSHLRLCHSAACHLCSCHLLKRVIGLMLCTVQDVVDASTLSPKAAQPAACACNVAMQAQPCSQQLVCTPLLSAHAALPKQLPGTDSPLPTILPLYRSLHAPFSVLTHYFTCKEAIPALITKSPICKAKVSTAPIHLPYFQSVCLKTLLCLCDGFAPAKNGRHLSAQAHIAMQEDLFNENCSEVSSC